MTTVLIILSAAALTSVAVSVVMFCTAVLRRETKVTPWMRDECFTEAEPRLERYGDVFSRGREWLREAGNGEGAKELTIESFDGLRLLGRMIENPACRGIVLMCHGYRSNPIRDFGAQARTLYDEGFSLLMIDQRAHGGSEGKYISYGVNERFDIRDWCRRLNSLYPGKPVILYGESMGAAAVMMAAGLSDIPPCVRAVIADCGFTSPGEILRRVMWDKYHIPPFPVYHLFALLTRLAAGFSLNGADTREALRGCKIPLLLIHGRADRFVPFSMGEENRRAAKNSRFLPVEGAGHLCAFAAAPEKYSAALRLLFQGAGI